MNPQNEREDLLNRLWDTRTLIPGAEQMELSELRDRVQAQEGKMSEGYYDKKAPAKRKAPMTAKEMADARGALKEYSDWRRRRQQMTGAAPKDD
jgi:hypothetical protein